MSTRLYAMSCPEVLGVLIIVRGYRFNRGYDAEPRRVLLHPPALYRLFPLRLQHSPLELGLLLRLGCQIQGRVSFF